MTLHIPDGYLGPPTYGALWAAMVPIWMVASKRVKEKLELSQAPFLAMASAFSLVVMVLSIPLPGGTTGHITGTTLLAILLGPWPAVLTVSLALTIQALMFGVGGITTLGANCFNIAFSEAWVGYGIYRLITTIGSALARKKPDSPPRKTMLHCLAGGIASYAAINLGGLLTAVELGVQPVLHGGAGQTPYFPFPLKIAIPAIMLPHLTFVGLLEASLTTLILVAAFKIQPRGFSSAKRLLLILLIIVIWNAPRPLYAHDYWIEKKGPEFVLVFGHRAERIEVDPSKIKTLKALGLQGKEIGLRKEKKGKDLTLKPEESPSLLFVEIDDGYWSKTIYGWKNLPKRKASRVVESLRSIYYSKILLGWNEAVQKTLADSKLDILPLENPWGIRGGEFLKLRVLYQNRPISGLQLEGGEHQKLSVTNHEGIVKMQLLPGHQVISVKYKEALKNDPDADHLSVTSTLSLEVPR